MQPRIQEPKAVESLQSEVFCKTQNYFHKKSLSKSSKFTENQVTD